MLKNYYLGCPIWANKEWVGHFYSSKARPKQYLREYSLTFNSVEGNSTFYGLPTPSTVARWRDEVHPGFRFSFKFPKSISHLRQLHGCQDLLKDFFDRINPLAERIGILFLQLPPTFNAQALSLLVRFLNLLPETYHYAVEVRHIDFFEKPEAVAALNAALAKREVNRAMFDTAMLHQIRTSDPSVVAAQRRKPKMPVRYDVTGAHPFLRFVGDNTVSSNVPYLVQLAKVVAGWIDAGQHPYVFFHSPDDIYAPQLCRAFHETLTQQVRTDIGTLPDFPVNREADSTPRNQQLDLFG